MRHIRVRLHGDGSCTPDTHCGGAPTVEDIWPGDAIAAVAQRWAGLCHKCMDLWAGSRIASKAEILSAPRRFKWTVEFTVAEVWVADGFDLTPDRALQMLGRTLPYANMSSELEARVIDAPAPTAIRRAQGYKD